MVSVCRFGAGGIFRAFRTRRIVDTLTRWPSLSSSPWIGWYRQPWFPGGEAPDQRGDLGTDQRPAGPARVGLLLSGQVTVPPRGMVSGVTSRCARSLLSRSAISAASTARPAQSSRGRAWCGAARRSRAAAPAGPRLQAPANGRAGPASHRAERRSGRAGEKTPLIIMPTAMLRPSPQVTGIGRLLEPDRQPAVTAPRRCRQAGPGRRRRCALGCWVPAAAGAPGSGSGWGVRSSV